MGTNFLDLTSPPSSPQPLGPRSTNTRAVPEIEELDLTADSNIKLPTAAKKQENFSHVKPGAAVYTGISSANASVPPPAPPFLDTSPTIHKRKSACDFTSPAPKRVSSSTEHQFDHTSHDDDDDEEDSGNDDFLSGDDEGFSGDDFTAIPGTRGLMPLNPMPQFDVDTGYIDAVQYASKTPSGGLGEQLRKLVDSIPLRHRAPVGRRRRLVKKKDLDAEGGEVTTHEELDEAELIEEDRLRIQEAATRMECKKKYVKLTRKEEVVISSMGEIVSKGADSSGSTPSASVGGGDGAAVAGGKSILDAIDDSEDEDMKLHRPGSEGPVKGKGKEVEKARPAQPGINDAMEWIQGNQLGQRDSGRHFRDVIERTLRWRVPGMISPLLDHQVLGVDWMVGREYSQDMPRGGLVADAMGLGKTIQSIATMVMNPPPPAEKWDDPIVTLIVAPVALLQQWRDEIETHSKHGYFDVHIHHGQDKIKSLATLKRKNVVITSYATIMHSYPSPKRPKRKMSDDDYEEWWDTQWQKRGMFHRMKFWRVILDEAHIIKNRYSRTSLACQHLDSMHSWALTGTPISNSLDDLFPLFSFMGHPQLGQLDQFRAVSQGRDIERAAQRMQLLLRGVMMRRNKTDQIMGKPLIVLPEKRIRMVELEFNDEERRLYECVESMSRDVMNRYIRQGTVMKNYSSVLAMLMRLRQICNHPYLILQSINKDFTVTDLELAINGVPSGDGQVAQPMGPRSNLRGILEAAKNIPVGDARECAICLDAMDGPVITRCRHVFCRDCIEGIIIREGNSAPCPLCKRVVAGEDLTDWFPADRADEERNQSGDWLDRVGEFTHSAKTLALRDQLLEWRENHPGDKIVLFSQFVKMLDVVEKVTEEEGWVTVRYQGGMRLSDREASLRTFRDDPDCWIMLTSLRAGGVGLNLTHANLVLSLDLWWNAAVEAQAFDRVHRMGQYKEVFITRFIVKGTVEQRILGLQISKQHVADAALGDGDGLALGRLGRAELMGLFGDVIRDEHGREKIVRRAPPLIGDD